MILEQQHCYAASMKLEVKTPWRPIPWHFLYILDISLLGLRLIYFEMRQSYEDKKENLDEILEKNICCRIFLVCIGTCLDQGSWLVNKYLLPSPLIKC